MLAFDLYAQVADGQSLTLIPYTFLGKDAKVRGLAAPSNLSMNQNLDGHTGKCEFQ